MNTDNMNVSGETIDYGPCAFMDEYQAGKTFSSIDFRGRYAYSNQPRAAQWNLAVLAQCLLPLIQNEDADASADAVAEEAAIEKAQTVIDGFPQIYQAEFVRGMRCKLGIEKEQEDDLLLGSELLELMETGKADFTLTYYRLYQIARATVSAEADEAASDGRRNWLQLFAEDQPAIEWLERWHRRIAENTFEKRITDNNWLETMRLSNPAIIPRNHNIENAINEAVNNNSYKAFDELLQACSQPFATTDDDNDTRKRLMLPPQPEEEVTMTFCGT